MLELYFRFFSDNSFAIFEPALLDEVILLESTLIDVTL